MLKDKNEGKGKRFDIISEIGSQVRKGKDTASQEESNPVMQGVPVSRYGTYEGYKDVVVNKAMQGDKYKINFSLGEAPAQKLQYIQTLEQVGLREYSKIAETAFDLLYEVKFLLNTKVVDADPQTLIKMIQNMKSKEK